MLRLSDKQLRILTAVLLLLGAVWIGASARLPGGSASPGIEAPQHGFLAPDFELQTLNGETVRLSDLRGQAVMLNFWATWCAPCRAEMPAMQRIYEEYEAQGFVVLAVNTTYNDSMAKAAEFAREYGLSFPILLDTDSKVSQLYYLQATPTTFFIDPEGVIQEVVLGGPMAEALLRTRVEGLLGEVSQ